VRRLSPPLRRFFVDFKVLIKVSKRGLPALRRTLKGLGPVLEALDPFLANLNPVVRFLNAYQGDVADFLANPHQGMAGALPTLPGQPSARHFLRNQLYSSSESLAIHPERLETNRGNGYMQPFALNGQLAASSGMPFPSFDCRNAGGDVAPSDPRVGPAFAPCVTPPDFPGVFGGKRAPNLFADP
jgi:hypothetical protein